MRFFRFRFTSSVFDWKYYLYWKYYFLPFWTDLVQKVKIVTLSWNWVPRLIRISRIQWWFQSIFDWKFFFFTNLVEKNQNCQFKLKFVTKTNPSLKNSMVVFTFSFLDCKCRLWANLVRNIKIVSLSWNLVIRLIRICRIQWWC